MQRRAFIGLATCGVAGLAFPVMPAARTPAAADLAAARIGRQALATVSPATLESVRSLIPSLPVTAADLQPRIAADHRAGRIVKVKGVSLSLSETAWCVAAAESPAA